MDVTIYLTRALLMDAGLFPFISYLEWYCCEKPWSFFICLISKYILRGHRLRAWILEYTSGVWSQALLTSCVFLGLLLTSLGLKFLISKKSDYCNIHESPYVKYLGQCLTYSKCCVSWCYYCYYQNHHHYPL